MKGSITIPILFRGKKRKKTCKSRFPDFVLLYRIYTEHLREWSFSWERGWKTKPYESAS